MAVELPMLSAVVARLAHPEINLAAYGGVVFPLSLIVESPIIMLLAASTALSKDHDSYLKLYRWMMRAGAVLTALHIAVAFTPLYYVVVEGIIGAPPEILEPARLGLMIMTPWTWSIAYRRFHQGVLIRFGHARVVGLGTVVRLTANALVLSAGYLIGTLPGIVVGASAVASGVVSEAVYVGIRVRPVLNGALKEAPRVEPLLALGGFLTFYVPLALTSLLNLLAQPIGSAALSRMPDALGSLAVWPVISGLTFMMRSAGVGYNEVVVALLDESGAARQLRRFTVILTSSVTVLILIVALTPLAGLWFEQVSALNPRLAAIAGLGLLIAIPLPGMAVLQSWYQGAILNSKRTRGITESVAIALLTSAAVYGFGVWWGRVTGLYMGMIALLVSNTAQTAWLWVRSRRVMQAADQKDALIAEAVSGVTSQVKA